MRLTKDEAVRLHREMWGWLTENPDKEKEDWPRWKWKWRNGGEVEGVFALCFACEYSKGCDKCLFVWPGADCQHGTGGGLYNKWLFEKNAERRAALAAQIRDLPVRDD